MFFPRIYPVDSNYNVSQDAMEFIDNIMLPAIGGVCPFDRQNFGVSFAADGYRFRDQHGHVHVRPASVPGILCTELVGVMHVLVENAGERFAKFKGFFFDTWTAGIKEPLDGTIEETLTDLDWDLVEPETAFIDFGLEVLRDGWLVGVPYQSELPNIMGGVFGYQEMASRCESRLVFIIVRCRMYSHAQLYI